MGKQHLDLLEMDHWNLCGLSNYVVQCVRGLAEEPVGPYYKHREGVQYTRDFYVDPMIGGTYRDKPVFYPNHFPQVEIRSRLEDDIYHMDGDDQPVLRSQLHRKFNAHACAI